ncbi:MAG: peptidase M50, partial [Gammaproteobacteria bacterium]|nr:peptidase M50 [Gammaproteobacteria bacterium]
AMLLWIAVEPGLVRQVAFDVMLIGAVSSVFFNGNPLLRFDGYYVLADAIEIPNLATRARSQLSYLARRWLFRVPDIQPPAHSRGEALWLTGYGLGAFVYRLFVTTVIAIFLASHYLVIGVGLALWAVFSQVLMPIANGLRYLATSPEIASRRQPVAATVAALCAVGVLTATLVPVGATTTTTGVVWPSEDFVVRVGSDCFVREIAVPSGQKVGVGSLLLRCDNIDLIADRDVERDRLQEIKRKHQHLALRKQVKRKILADEIALVTTAVAALEARVSDLSVYSDVEGIFVVPDANSLVGRFIPQGRIIGYIVNDGALTVRAVVSQDEIGLVRTRTEAVTLRPSADVTKLWRSHVVREVPAASNRLPSPALGTAGGGPVAVSASDPTLAIEPVFQVELAMPAGSFDGRLGGHVYVRFEHGAEPLVAHAARLLRQLFLKYFEV